MINILSPTEYILSHDDLASKSDRGDSPAANVPCFKNDILKGRLDNYKNTFVAYQKGILCGQSKDGKELYNFASSYYGFSSLAVFKVPNSKVELENLLNEAIGNF